MRTRSDRDPLGDFRGPRSTVSVSGITQRSYHKPVAATTRVAARDDGARRHRLGSCDHVQNAVVRSITQYVAMLPMA